MAILKAEFTTNLESIRQLIQIFPELNGRFLSLVGKRGRTILKEEYLYGQDLTLKAFPKDKLGRFTITSDVNRKRTQVKIYSYPVNLFERGRMLRSGRKEPGNFIITRKLKQAIMSRMGSYVNEFEDQILNPEIRKVGL